MTKTLTKDQPLHPSESQIQRGLVEWVRWMYPQSAACLVHLANEGKRSQREGAKQVAMGLCKCASDLFLAQARHGYHGMWIELKSHSGRLTTEQRQFLERMDNEGYFTCTTRSLDENIEKLLWYLN